MGSAFVQGIANASDNVAASITLMAWLIMHAVLQLGMVLYIVSLGRLGQSGLNRRFRNRLKLRTSFLPWFAIGAPSIIVMWAAIGLLSIRGLHLAIAFAHCVACFQALAV